MESELVYCSTCRSNNKITSNELSFSELDQIEGSCPDHDNSWTMFCFTCDKPLCDTCTSDLHRAHEYLTLNEASAVKATELRSRSHDLKISLRSAHATKEKTLQIKEDLYARAEEVTYQIYTTFGQYIRALQEREQALIAEVEGIQRAKEKVLDLQIQEIEKDLRTAEHTCSFTKTLIEQGSALDIITAHSTVLSRIDTLEESRQHPAPPESDDIKFIPEDGDVFLEATAQLGRVEGNRRTFPQKSRFAEEPPRCLLNGSEQCWTLVACDVLGSCVATGGDQVVCSVKNEASSERYRCEISDGGDGTYELNFTPLHPGKLRITVGINNRHVQGSPFSVSCQVRRDYALVGECLLFGGAKGSKLGELLHPTAIALNKAETKLYVSDSDNHRIQVWSYPELQCLTSFGCQGNALGQFSYPYGLCVAGDKVYVADCKNHRVQILSTEGSPLGAIGEHGFYEGQLSHPYDVVVDEQGRVYVSDSANFRIQVFSNGGDFLFSFGGKGTKEGQMLCPWGLHVTDQMITVADFKNNNVQFFTKKGEFVRQIRDSENNVSLSNPAGLTGDREGNVIVCDRSSHCVQIFDGEGRFVSRFGTRGSHLGNMKYPTGVVLDSSGNIIVCDAFNHRIQIF